MTFPLSAVTSLLSPDALARTAHGLLDSIHQLTSDPASLVAGVLDKVGLNPQPLPPKYGSELIPQDRALDPGKLFGDLNLPHLPGPIGGISKFLDDCGTVPRKFPFPPPPPGPWAELANSALNFR